MKLPTFRQILGAFRILRRRAVEVERPGLTVWTDAGEAAAVAVGEVIRDEAHAAETNAAEIAGELREILADGKVTPAELKKLKRIPDRLRGVAEKCHDVGEVVRS